MAYLSKSLREQVIQRARGFCEYCQTSQQIVVEMEIDHIKPEADGGQSVLPNLGLACISCNSHKRDFQTGIDPETRQEVALFNPRTQHWDEHFAWIQNGTIIMGLTPTGRATVERLQMNRELIVRARQRWVKAGWHPPKF